MDRDVERPSRDDFVWRSAEVERRRSLQFNGVLDAVRHPRYGQAANLKKTLGVCMAALLAVGAMIGIGMQMRDGNSNPSGGPVSVVAEVVESGTDGVPVEELVSEVSSEAAVRAPVVDLSGLEAEASPLEVTQEPNRADCDAIWGTDYLSETERNWYLESCVAEPEPVFASIAGGAVIEPVVLEQEPEVEEEFSSDMAIAAGAEWITTQSEVSYEVGVDSCNASHVGSLWLVTCQATLTGCDVEICTSWAAVCVAEPDGALIPTKRC